MSSSAAAANKTTEKPSVWWEVPLRFLVETLTGASIFLVIAAAAVGLSVLVRYLDGKNIDGVILLGLKAGEYGLFLMDLLLFGRFLYRTTVRTWGEL